MTQENKFIGQVCKHKHRSYHEAKNPFTGSLLERQVQRAMDCIEHKNKELSDMFEAETGMTPEAFIDKWEKKLL